MKALSTSVKELFKQATSQERAFFRKAPSLATVEKELENFQAFLKDGRARGRRFNMGDARFRDNVGVVGYNSFTVMNNASATPYERKNIDMGSGMNYVQLRKLFVHPDFREEGIGSGLVEGTLEVAKRFGKHCIADVMEENYAMINILERQGFQSDFHWSTPNGIVMTRFYHD